VKRVLFLAKNRGREKKVSQISFSTRTKDKVLLRVRGEKRGIWTMTSITHSVPLPREGVGSIPETEAPPCNLHMGQFQSGSAVGQAEPRWYR
jgi:hypothetical protein